MDFRARARGLPWGAIVFLSALLTGLAMVFVVFKAQSLADTRPDPYFFGAMGKSVAHGDGLLPFGSLIKRRAPLYPLTIGALYWTFGEREWLLQLLQCAFHAGTCWLVFDLGRRMFNLRTGVLAALATALHPLLLRYVPDLHLETQFTFLLTLSIWQSQRFLEKPDARRGALLGVTLALASLTKSVPMLYPFFFAGAVALMALRARRGETPAQALRPLVLPLAAMFVLMAAVVSPWTYRNYQTTGHFIPISSGGSDAFLRGYIFSRTEFITYKLLPYTDAENETNATFRALCAKEGAVWEQDDWQTDQILNRAAKAKLKAEPLLFVRKFVVGLFTFWYELTTLKNALLAAALALLAWAFAIPGLLRAKREGRAAWPLWLPIAYTNLLLAALLALGRYSAPVLPELMLLAAFGLDGILARREAARA
ncbi:MAG: glycosyltransferase family 39 protein [Deltaproteobacteria bacterium]|nr:glycosyltransferase family 39 protein [Deltaproteobacteria bacterium]